MVEKESLGNEIYSGVAGFGRIEAWISAIIGTIIAIIAIIFGIYIIIHKGHLKSVTGTVTKSSYGCTTTTDTNNNKTTITTICSFNVTYTVGTQTYNKTFSSTDTLSQGDSVTIWYDPNNPDKGEYNPAPTYVGWLIIGIALFVSLGLWLWVWITNRSKFAAAVGGASAAIEMFRR